MIKSLLLIGLLGSLALAQFAQAADADASRKLYHVVSLKFKATATPEDIKKIQDAFVALKDKIDGVESLNWGTDISPEHKNKGFTHCFVLTFNSEKTRDAYLEHPQHKAFVKMLGPVLDDVIVIDFWSGQ
jgi:hypothetical protein